MASGINLSPQASKFNAVSGLWEDAPMQEKPSLWGGGSGLSLSSAAPTTPAPTEITSQQWGTQVNADAGIADTAANNGAAGSGEASLATMQAIKSSLDNVQNYSSQGSSAAANVGGGVGAASGAIYGGMVGFGVGGPIGAAIGAGLGSAAGGAVGLGAGTLLDFVATSDSKDKAELEARQRAAKLRQYENMAKQQESVAYTAQQRDKKIADKALAAQRMRDMMAIYMGRKTAKLVRQGLVAPNAPATQVDTSGIRNTLAQGII